MSLLGKPLTAAFSGLIARQSFDHTNALTPSLALCLQYLQLALSIVPSCRVPVYPRLTEPVIVYTDASTAAPTPLGFRLGIWILCDEHIWVDINAQRGCCDLGTSPDLHQPT